jgi:hypothetical protein
MRIEQLTTAMLEHEQYYDAPNPDLTELHLLGTRRRQARRAAAVAATIAAVIAAVIAGALVAQSLVNRAETPQPVKPDGTTVLSSYERRVLNDIPGSFAVRGQVVMPVTIDPENPAWIANQVDGFMGRLAPLGWDAMLDGRDGSAYTRADYPAYLRQPPPENSQVIQDIGRCTWDAGPCLATVAVCSTSSPTRTATGTPATGSVTTTCSNRESRWSSSLAARWRTTDSSPP